MENQQTTMTVDFDAVFGNKTAPSNNGTQPAAGKASSDWKLKTFRWQHKRSINTLTSLGDLLFLTLGVCFLT